MLPSSDITDLSLDASDREADNQANRKQQSQNKKEHTLLFFCASLLDYEPCVVSSRSLCSDHTCS